MLSQALAEEHHLRIGGERHDSVAQPDDGAGGRGAHEHRLGARRGDHDRRGVREGWGSEDASAYLVGLRAGERKTWRGQIGEALGPGSGLAVQTAQAHAGEQNALSRQGFGTADADRDADPGGRGARDGGGDREHGLAAPPAAGEAEARGLRAARPVAHDPRRGAYCWSRLAARRGRSGSTASSCSIARSRT